MVYLLEKSAHLKCIDSKKRKLFLKANAGSRLGQFDVGVMHGARSPAVSDIIESQNMI